MKLTHINKQALCEACLSILLALLISYLLVSGIYKSLVSPRSFYWLWFFVALLFIWGLLSAKRLFTVQYQQKYWHCFTCIIPLILLSVPLLIYPNYAIASPSDNKEISVVSIDDKPFGYDLEAVTGDGIDRTHKRILLNSNNYYKTILQITKNVDEFKGYEVVMTGFVSYSSPELTGNEFTTSRLLLICCLADLASFGMVTEPPNNERLPEGTWITVKGYINTRMNHGRLRPYVTNVEIMDAMPIDGYIYPNL